MEQTGTFNFWLSAIVGGAVVVLNNWLIAPAEPTPGQKRGLGWLPGTAYLACLIVTTGAAALLCLLFKLPITADAVTSHATLAMTAYGLIAAGQQHVEAKSTRAASVDKGTTNVTGG